MADHFKNFKELHKKYLNRFVGRHYINGLEIGVAHGHATKFYLDNILTGDHTNMYAIDVKFQEDYWPIDKGYDNLHSIEMDSHEALTGLRHKDDHRFDFIYIDGYHSAKHVLFDAVLAWDMLNVGGIMIFDDYGWGHKSPPYGKPKPGIDAFLVAMQHHYNLLEIYANWQVVIEKVECPYSLD